MLTGLLKLTIFVHEFVTVHVYFIFNCKSHILHYILPLFLSPSPFACSAAPSVRAAPLLQASSSAFPWHPCSLSSLTVAMSRASGKSHHMPLQHEGHRQSLHPEEGKSHGQWITESIIITRQFSITVVNTSKSFLKDFDITNFIIAKLKIFCTK